jgi:hypothetical protein
MGRSAPNGRAMRRIDRKGLEGLAEILAGLFYLLMFVTLLAVVTASPGTALGLLILGSCAHVLRVGVERLAAREDRAAPGRSAAGGRRA